MSLSSSRDLDQQLLRELPALLWPAPVVLPPSTIWFSEFLYSKDCVLDLWARVLPSLYKIWWARQDLWSWELPGWWHETILRQIPLSIEREGALVETWSVPNLFLGGLTIFSEFKVLDLDSTVTAWRCKIVFSSLQSVWLCVDLHGKLMHADILHVLSFGWRWFLLKKLFPIKRKCSM